MMDRESKYKTFEASADFSEQVMQKVRLKPIPKASLGRRLSQWGERVQETRTGLWFIIACQLLAGLLNVFALNALLIGG